MPSQDGSPEEADVTAISPIKSFDVDPPPAPSRPSAKSSKLISRTVSQSVTSQFSGPMPPPEYLARYEQICPGSADRMLAMAEKEADHRRTTETTIVAAQIEHHNKQFSEARRGQICAVIITLAGLGAGLYAAIQGHEITGGVLGVGGIGGIVTTFILGRTKQKDDEEEQPAPKTSPNRIRRRKDRRN